MGIFDGFETRPDYENQNITEIGRLTAHSSWDKQKDTLCLDGVWRFKLVPSVKDVGENFWLEDGYTDISVPGNIETQGFAKPVYTNSVYPFKDEPGKRYLMNPGDERAYSLDCRLNPPFVPDENPVGLYVKTVALPEGALTKRAFITFDGVECAFYLFVNGHKAGYAQDSKLPSTFEISSLLKEGENTIAAAVLRFSDGFWLEDQDYFYVTGIYRHVNLFFKPRVFIRDTRVEAYPAGEGKGEILARAELGITDGFADRSVRLSVFAPDGTKVHEETRYVDALSPIHGKQMGGYVTRRPERGSASFLFKVDRPLLWDTDRPNLYTCVFTSVGPDGKDEDRMSVRTGFRSVCIENGIIKLNGKRVVFRGVDRHEHGYECGRAVPRETMEAEIKLMKQLNFNAVRTSHYPDSPEWYDLCDEYGIMVLCEANCETHGVQGNITTDPSWAGAMLERAKRMVLTHKNHPSIVGWSLGNESGCGTNHAAMAGWIRGYDTRRFVQYENNDRDSVYSDVRATMYAPYEMILDMVGDINDCRPIVLIEYSYQISNTGGRADLFNYLTDKYPRFQGGFVWDWQDKLLPARTEDGRVFPGYGGDFGEDYVDQTVPPCMCANGVITHGLTPKPCALEFKQAQTPVEIQLYNSRGVVLVKNRLQSVDFDEIEIRYSLAHEGKTIFEGAASRIWETDQMVLAARANNTDERNVIPWPALLKDGDALFECDLSKAAEFGSEVQLNVYALHARATLWSEAGFEYTRAQFELKGAAEYRREPAEGEVAARMNGNTYTLSAGGAEYVFDLSKGCLEEAFKDGERLLLSGGNPALFRARTGMCAGWGWYSDMTPGYKALMPEDLPLTNVKRELIGREARFVRDFAGKFGVVRVKTVYTVDGGGNLDVYGEIDVPKAYRFIPRAGLEFTVAPGFEDVSWYGRSPDSYIDRKLACPLGEYSAGVDDMHFPFTPPSHCGTCADTRRVTLSNKTGRAVNIEGTPFSFTAHHSTESEYYAAAHDHELRRADEIALAICPYESGIGGNMAWSTEYDVRDMLPAGVYRFAFTVSLT